MDLISFYTKNKEHVALALFIVVAIRVLLFCLEAMGIYFLAKKEKMEKPFLSFVPVVYPWALGKVAEKGDSKKSNYSLILLSLSVAKTVVFTIMVILAGFSVKAILDNAFQAVTENISMTADMFYSFIPVIVFIVITLVLAIIFAVYYFIALYKIYADHTKKWAPWLLVGSVCATAIKSVIIFVLGLKNAKEE